MAQDTLAIAGEWHEAFDVPIADAPNIPNNRAMMRLVVLDALRDIQYALDFTFLQFGPHPIKGDAMAEVNASNMSKLGPDGRPVLRGDGKVLNRPDFRRPDLARFLLKAPQTMTR